MDIGTTYPKPSNVCPTISVIVPNEIEKNEKMKAMQQPKQFRELLNLHRR